jgi:20S proteasome alpha/beta subunit
MRHLPLVVFLACQSHGGDASISSSSSSSSLSAKAPPPPPWQQDQQLSQSTSSLSTASSVREAAFYSDLPPTVFNPSGRLVSLESAVQKLSDPLDPSGSLVVAIHCRQGMAVVASVPQSPYLYDPAAVSASAESSNTSASAIPNEASDERNTTTLTSSSTSEDNVASAQSSATGSERSRSDDRPLLELFKSPTIDAGASDETSLLVPIYPPPLPFCVMGSALLGAVGGSASDGLVLRTRLQRMAHELREDGEESGGGEFMARTVARRLADSFHARTLREASDRDGNAHRILACGAIVCDSRELWRVDPSGQFYRCRAAVAGRASPLAETVLIEALLDRRMKAAGADGASEEAAAGVAGYHGRHIKQDLLDLTLHDALEVATLTVRKTLQKAAPSANRRGGEAERDGAIRILGMTLPIDSASTTEWHDEDRLADILRKLEELEA